MSNILIIKHGSLGDIAQACGAIQDISENHPDDQIHLLTTKPYYDLFKTNPYISNVILEGGTTGTRLRGSQWFYDSNNAGRLYFTINGHTYYKATTGHHFRVNGDVTRLNIGPTGAINIGGGDTLVSGTAVLAVANTVVLDTSRNLTNIGNISSGAITTSGAIVQSTGQSHYFRGVDNNWRIGSDIVTDSGGLVTGAATQIIVGGSGNLYGFQIFGHQTSTTTRNDVKTNSSIPKRITNAVSYTHMTLPTILLV